MINFNAGLRKSQLVKIINNNLNKNADLLIGVDDPEVNQLIEVLVDGISDAIAENNQAIEQQITDLIQDLKEEANPQGVYPLRGRRIY